MLTTAANMFVKIFFYNGELTEKENKKKTIYRSSSSTTHPEDK